MKKLVLLLISLLTLTSCSKDDDSTSKDPIIGTWYQIEVPFEHISDCILHSTTTFKSNGTFRIVNIYEDKNGKCSEKNKEVTGKWKNIDYGGYQFAIENNEFGERTRVDFEDNFNLLIIGRGSKRGAIKMKRK